MLRVKKRGRAVLGDSNPVEGFYALKMAKGGTLVPVHIWYGVSPDPGFPDNPMDRGATWHFQRGHEAVQMSDVWPWAYDRPISERQYRHMLRLENWARTEAPGEPEANPRAPVPWETMEPMF